MICRNNYNWWVSLGDRLWRGGEGIFSRTRGSFESLVGSRVVLPNRSAHSTSSSFNSIATATAAPSSGCWPCRVPSRRRTKATSRAAAAGVGVTSSCSPRANINCCNILVIVTYELLQHNSHWFHHDPSRCGRGSSSSKGTHIGDCAILVSVTY